MIDWGLLLSFVAMLAVPAAVARLWTPTSLMGASLLEVATAPLVAGLLIGRAWAMALDNPSGLTRLGDVLVIRSGVELWPGVFAGIAVAAWRAGREHVPPLRRLADLAPFGLLAYAAYEGACLLRDGCYGPPSIVGLVPSGLSTRMFPIGIAVALGVVALAFAVRRIPAEPQVTVLLVLAGVAAVRSLASIWLPRLGAAPTRQHLSSLVVLAAASAGLVASVAWQRRQGRAVRRLLPEGEG